MRTLSLILLIVVAVCFCVTNASAQEAKPLRHRVVVGWGFGSNLGEKIEFGQVLLEQCWTVGAYTISCSSQQWKPVYAKFGGGHAPLLEYMYKPTRYFGLSAGLSYQWSLLDKARVKEIKGSFKRGALHLAPVLVAPFSRSMRNGGALMVGGGPSFYTKAQLHVDRSGVPGGDDILMKYKPVGAYNAFIAMDFLSSSSKLGSIVGAKLGLYRQRFKVDEYRVDGGKRPPSTLKDEYKRVDGSTVMLSIFAGPAF